MNKTLLVSSLIACLSIASVNVYAEGESSISIGYAQSRVKEDGYKSRKMGTSWIKIQEVST